MADTDKGIPAHLVAREVRAALAEDIGPGDLTSDALVSPGVMSRARITACEDLTLAGLPLAVRAFRHLDNDARFAPPPPAGTVISRNGTILEIEAAARAILGAERTALNFLARLSGIATLTRKCVDAVSGTGALILDTRKTTPGWRLFEREAVRLGGGVNHRFGLFDAVLIKDNHLALFGDPARAVRVTRERYGDGLMIEVELEDLAHLEPVLKAGCDIVLLDNMTPRELTEAVMRRDAWVGASAGKRSALLEASGGITHENIRSIAESGVDRISMGALTHSAPSADVRLEMES